MFFLGFFPCQKVTSPESGTIRLIPLSGCSALTRQILTISIFYGSAAFCLNYVQSNGLDFAGFMHSLSISNALAFYLIYLNVCLGLFFWIQTLKEQPNQNRIDDYLRFLKGLDLAKKTFSPGLFSWCFLSLLIIILGSFEAINYSIEFGSKGTELLGVFVGLVVNILLHIFIVFSTNVISQAVTDKVKDLSNRLKIQVPISNDPMVLIEGMRVPKEMAYDFVIGQLEDFHGFDGNGYSILLGKSLLTGILTNFATYLIILIQFKTSE